MPFDRDTKTLKPCFINPHDLNVSIPPTKNSCPSAFRSGVQMAGGGPLWGYRTFYETEERGMSSSEV